jgi:hypothetical protein
MINRLNSELEQEQGAERFASLAAKSFQPQKGARGRKRRGRTRGEIECR